MRIIIMDMVTQDDLQYITAHQWKADLLESINITQSFATKNPCMSSSYDQCLTL